MKPLLALALLSSIALAAPKDPRIDIAKRETAKLYRENVSTRYGVEKINVIEQSDTYFLTQIIAKNKKNFCFILEVNITDTTPEVTFIENNNDVMGVFFRECSAKPTGEELHQFKVLNGWPAYN